MSWSLRIKKSLWEGFSKRGLDRPNYLLYNSPYAFEFGRLNENLKEIFQTNLVRPTWLKFKGFIGLNRLERPVF